MRPVYTVIVTDHQRDIIAQRSPGRDETMTGGCLARPARPSQDYAGPVLFSQRTVKEHPSVVYCMDNKNLRHPNQLQSKHIAVCHGPNDAGNYFAIAVCHGPNDAGNYFAITVDLHVPDCSFRFNQHVQCAVNSNQPIFVSCTSK
jgi:hypothetical protein